MTAPSGRSRPARGAWIEMGGYPGGRCRSASRPARGAWIEIWKKRCWVCRKMSRPARGAWIEILILRAVLKILEVAPRKGRVDLIGRVSRREVQ